MLDKLLVVAIIAFVAGAGVVLAFLGLVLWDMRRHLMK